MFVFINLAGTPPHISFSGMFVVTTEPAAIIELEPTVTPFKIVASLPIKQFLAIFIGLVWIFWSPLIYRSVCDKE